MKIEFSTHSLLKIEILKSHGVILTPEFVENIVKNPEKIDKGYVDRLIAQGRLDEAHILRVVYEEKSNYTLVVTMYPGRRSRYEKD